MPENVEIEPAETAATEPQPEAQPQNDDLQEEGVEKDWEAEASRWKALSRKHEARAKENADKAKAHDEFVESQKTEQQKLADARDAAVRQASETEAQLAVMKAAIKYGLAEEDLDLLEGVSADQVDARAKRIAERLGANKNGNRFPDLGQGRGAATGPTNDMNSLIRQAAGR